MTCCYENDFDIQAFYQTFLKQYQPFQRPMVSKNWINSQNDEDGFECVGGKFHKEGYIKNNSYIM